jgi:hypothetical protein
VLSLASYSGLLYEEIERLRQQLEKFEELRAEIERLRHDCDEARRATVEMACEYIDSIFAADYWFDRYEWLEGEMRKAAIVAEGGGG